MWFVLVILRAKPPAAGPPVLSDWLTGILEAQTWPNGLKYKEIWGAMLYAYGALNPSILEAWGLHFWGLGSSFWCQFADPGSLGTPNRTPWSPDFDFCRFLIDSGFPWRPTWRLFCWLWATMFGVWAEWWFFSGLGVEIMPGLDAQMCLKHSKYWCFW